RRHFPGPPVLSRRGLVGGQDARAPRPREEIAVRARRGAPAIPYQEGERRRPGRTPGGRPRCDRRAREGAKGGLHGRSENSGNGRRGPRSPFGDGADLPRLRGGEDACPCGRARRGRRLVDQEGPRPPVAGPRRQGSGTPGPRRERPPSVPGATGFRFVMRYVCRERTPISLARVSDPATERADRKMTPLISLGNPGGWIRDRTATAISATPFASTFVDRRSPR